MKFSTSENNLAAKKRELRQLMHAHRSTLFNNVTNSGSLLRDRFTNLVLVSPNLVIAAYKALGSEIDPGLLVEALRLQGHTIVLPVVVGRRKPLTFHRFEKTDSLTVGPMGILEPQISSLSLLPDILIVPLLAFDCYGNRLGYGGGYYDRTLRFLRKQKEIMAIGVAFSAQRVVEVPHTPHDIKLDKIVTESGIEEILPPRISHE